MTERFTTPENITGIQGIFEHANKLVDNTLTPSLLLVIWVVAVMLLIHKNYKPSDSCALASLFSLVLGTMLWAAGLLLQKYLIICIIMVILCTIWSLFDK